jgi:hypothetical protein
VSPRLKKQKAPQGPKLGFRSPFVLAKLGHDLRGQYEALFAGPLPGEIEGPLERLRGPGGEVEWLDERRRRRSAASRSHSGAGNDREDKGGS